MKITKLKSQEIANFLTKAKKQELIELGNNFSNEVQKLYDDSIPKEVIELQKKYPNYFENTSGCNLYGGGFNGQRITFNTPSIYKQNNRCALDLTPEQGKVIFPMFNKISDFKKNLQELKREIENVVLMLGTKVKVLKEFPEVETLFKITNGNCTEVSVCVADLREKIFTKK